MLMIRACAQLDVQDLAPVRTRKGNVQNSAIPKIKSVPISDGREGCKINSWNNFSIWVNPFFMPWKCKLLQRFNQMQNCS